MTEYRRSGMILHIYSDEPYISEPEAFRRAGGLLFPWTKIQHTNNRNPPRKRSSTCGMKYNEKHHGIRNWSIIGRIFWKMSKDDINADCHNINGTLTTAITSGNWQHSGKQHREWNKKNPKKTKSNRNDILLGTRQNTTKPFPHILRKRKEKLED